jgi:transmembrane protein EpsG
MFEVTFAASCAWMTSLYLGRVRVSIGSIFLALLPATILAAIRVDYGNDYASYEELFLGINSSSDMSLDRWLAEPGWVYLNVVFADLGFRSLLVCVVILSCYAFARLVKDHGADGALPWSVFIYLFSVNIWLIQMSAVRQAVAIAILCLAFSELLKGRKLTFLGSVLGASLFHVSAVAAAPLLYWISRRSSSNLLAKVVLVAGFILTALFGGELLRLTLTYFGGSGLVTLARYASYYTPSSGVFGPALFFPSFLILVGLYGYGTGQKYEYGSRAAIARGYLYALSLHMPMVDRVGYYLDAVFVVAIPLVLAGIANLYIRLLVGMVFCAYYLYTYFGFFSADVWMPHYMSYQSVLD